MDLEGVCVKSVRLHQCLCGTFLAILLCPLAAHASPNIPVADWAPELLPSENDRRQAQEPIRVRIPNLRPALMATIVVELDAIDITPAMQRRGETLVFTPSPALTLGEHQLRIIEFRDNGDIIERGNWQFTLRKNTLLREAELRSALNIEASRRVSEQNIMMPPDRAQANASLQLQGQAAEGGWRGAAYADMLASSQALIIDNERESHYTLGSYLLRSQQGPLTVDVGHQPIEGDNLIMQNFNRRGVSVGVQSEDQTAALRGFALRTEPITGFRYGLGVSDSRHRVSGATASLRPWAQRPNGLVIESSYLGGEGAPQSGSAVAGDESLAQGEAGNIVLNSRLWDQRLHLRGEYAVSDYDFDGSDGDLESERDDAYVLLMSVQPLRDTMIQEQPLLLDLGLEHKRIGPYFQSLAHPNLTPDRDLRRLFTRANWAGWDIFATAGHELDNVDDLPLLGQTSTRLYTLSGNYSPPPDFDKQSGEPIRSWLGQANYGLNYFHSKQEVEELGAVFSSLGDYIETENLTLNTIFAYTYWDWSLTYTTGRSEDFSDAVPDTTNHDAQLLANFRLGANQGLVLSPSVQQTVTDEEDIPFATGDDTRQIRNLIATLNTQLNLSEKLSLGLGYSMNQNRSSDDTSDSRTTDINANITWRVWQARGNQPGMSLWLNGLNHDVEDDINSNASISNSYQVFVGGTMTWAPSY